MLFQLDFMQEDQCILVDFEDNVIGYDDKFECHIFSPERPRGKLHRAFSVFLFDQSGRLLLQQRAKEKITFPEVWTNTCCSHPLTGYTPTEQDEPHHVADGSVPGVKRAAIRKLEHELGIPASQFEIDDFRFVARLHYWAADAVTHGPESPFGEHEIDYVLFVQKTVTLEPNASEVGGFEYVTPEQLLTLMMPESGRLWSPWFRILATRLLLPLWSRLPAILDGSERPDVTKIQRFDCAEEFLGGELSQSPPHHLICNWHFRSSQPA